MFIKALKPNRSKKVGVKHFRPNFLKPLLAVVLGIFRKMFKIFTKISCLKIN